MSTQRIDGSRQILGGLSSLAALPTVADRVAYSTALDTWSETPLTSFARTLLDDADAATARATLGTGTGNVTKVGIPANDQIGVWTGDGTLEGGENLTWSGSILGVGDAFSATPPGTLSILTTGGTGTDIAGSSLLLAGGRPTGSGTGGSIKFQTAAAGASGTTLRNLADRLEIDQRGNVVLGTAALATTATSGFLYVPSCAGIPTGTPIAYTGRVPIVLNTDNGNMYAFYGASWNVV